MRFYNEHPELIDTDYFAEKADHARELRKEQDLDAMLGEPDGEGLLRPGSELSGSPSIDVDSIEREKANRGEKDADEGDTGPVPG